MPARATAAPLSEPEISIERLEEAAEDDERAQASEGRVVEILKDTSSQTITLTVSDPDAS